jgi:tripartite-type tricarboxylate transporter receptor subunit TctC
MRYGRFTFAITALAIAGVSAMPAQSQSFNAESYFKGKTIEIVITSNAGGGQDTMTRLLMVDLSNYLPGKPRFIATNVSDMPGITAVHDAPASDQRITIGITTRASTLYISADEPGATHNPEKFRLAAGFSTTPSWTMIFNDAAKAYKTIGDAKGKADPKFVFAETVGDASGVVASTLYFSWICDTFSLPCRMVNVANANTNALAQDVRRGHLNVLDANSVTGMRLFEEEFKKDTGRVMIEYAEEGSAKLETSYPRPNLADLLPNEKAKQEFKAMLPVIGYAGVANVIFAGPAVPAEAVRAIGEAFVQQMKDPEQFKRVAAGRFGAFTPFVFGPDDAQRIYDASIKDYQGGRDLIRALQTKYYDKYWK